MSGALIRVNVGQYVWYMPRVGGIILCVLTGLYGPGDYGPYTGQGPIATIGKFSR